MGSAFASVICEREMYMYACFRVCSRHPPGKTYDMFEMIRFGGPRRGRVGPKILPEPANASFSLS